MDAWLAEHRLATVPGVFEATSSAVSAVWCESGDTADGGATSWQTYLSQAEVLGTKFVVRDVVRLAVEDLEAARARVKETGGEADEIRELNACEGEVGQVGAISLWWMTPGYPGVVFLWRTEASWYEVVYGNEQDPDADADLRQRRAEKYMSEIDKGELTAVEAQLATVEAAKKRGESVISDEVRGIKDRAERFERDRRMAVTPDIHNRLAALKERCDEIADDAEFSERVAVIEEAASGAISNVITAQNMVRELEATSEYLTKSGRFTEELNSGIRSARERIAWHRTRKKLDEAEIATARGQQKRVGTLRAEAGALLKQDWRMVFGKEPPPQLS